MYLSGLCSIMSENSIEKQLKDIIKLLQSIPKNSEDVNNIDRNPNSRYKKLEDYFENVIRPNKNYSEKEFNCLLEIAKDSLKKDFEEQSKSCFINDSECKSDDIIKAHSLSKKSGLLKISSYISKNEQVYYIERISSRILKPKLISISKASTFVGFCSHHDKIFNPIDNNTFSSEKERCFLSSLRSYAYTYHSKKSKRDFLLSTSNNPTSQLLSLKSTINSASNVSGTEGVNFEIPKPTSEQKEGQELLVSNSEKYRELFIVNLKSNSYDQLEYLTYETDYLSPIVCSSTMMLHIPFGNGHIVPNNENIYFGFPIMITVLPNENNNSLIILGRFKSDKGSDLIFKNLNNLKAISNEAFEAEISKLIIENVQNFYLSPKFWDSLTEEEQGLIINSISIPKTKFPEPQKSFDVLNFFDEKYKIS